MNLEYRTVKERVASFLLTHADRFGKKIASGIDLHAPIKRSDIAGSINASRETTSRELASLARQGLISLNGAEIIITQPDKLRAFLEA